MTPLLLAFAVAWGPPAPRGRVGSGPRRGFAPAWIPVLTAVATIAVMAVDRAAAVLAASAAAATVVHTVAQRRAKTLSRHREEATAVFLGHVVTNLSAGAALPVAASRAAEHLPASAPADVVADIRRTAAAVQAGASPELILRASASPELREVGALWALTGSRGLPVAEMLARARDRLDSARRHRAATQAALAGPKTTAVVLSALPAAGVAMGTVMGARPLSVLLGPGPGGWLLLAGTVLVCAGFVTCQRIIEGAAA